MTEYTSWDKEPVSSFLDRLFADFLILDYHGSIYGRRSLCVDFDMIHASHHSERNDKLMKAELPIKKKKLPPRGLNILILITTMF